MVLSFDYDSRQTFDRAFERIVHAPALYTHPMYRGSGMQTAFGQPEHEGAMLDQPVNTGHGGTMFDQPVNIVYNGTAVRRPVSVGYERAASPSQLQNRGYAEAEVAGAASVQSVGAAVCGQPTYDAGAPGQPANWGNGGSQYGQTVGAAFAGASDQPANWGNGGSQHGQTAGAAFAGAFGQPANWGNFQ